jgi:hypothetical protein
LAEEIVRGIYRVVIKDEFGAVVYIKNIDTLATNQWRSFNFLINKIFIPDAYKIEIHQAGFYPDSFRIRNFQAKNDSVI